ncbi:ATP-dependent dethiobiotin synthetase BioD 1 [Halioglobus japonicus]|nr:ATP-dependent dethiobiotin synthetase BioD 1 [Halioglobus japonicus]
MSKAWFVAGTDTGVGKTAVSCGLLAAAAEAGLRTAAVKPVAAGCDENGQNEDALFLQAAMTEDLDYSQVNPVALTAAIAPHIAAGLEGKRMQASRLAGLCRGVMLGGADFVLIEGAGGWRVPINPRETLADLAVELQLGVILVVGMRLGCINHALLTAEAIRRDGLQLAGWVANQPGPRMHNHSENLETLQQLLPAPLLGDIPFLPDWQAGDLCPHLDITSLITGPRDR